MSRATATTHSESRLTSPLQPRLPAPGSRLRWSRLYGDSLPLALAALAWAMVALGYRLARANRAYRYPWHLIGGLVSIAAPVAAFAIAPNGFSPALTLLAIGLLYLAQLRNSWPARNSNANVRHLQWFGDEFVKIGTN